MKLRGVIALAPMAAAFLLNSPATARATSEPRRHGKTGIATPPGGAQFTVSDDNAVTVGTDGPDDILTLGANSLVCAGGRDDFVKVFINSDAYGGSGVDVMRAYNGSIVVGESRNEFILETHSSSAANRGIGDVEIYVTSGVGGNGGSGSSFIHGPEAVTMLGGSGLDRIISDSTVTLIDCGSNGAMALFVAGSWNVTTAISTAHSS